MVNFAVRDFFNKTVAYMTNELILEALKNVQEPDLGKDIVTLDMVKDIVINDKNISFTVVLTTPACPMKDIIRNNCVKAIKQYVNKEAQVQEIGRAHV